MLMSKSFPSKEFPFAPLGNFPTALSPMDGLRRALGGGPRLFVKRDDCSGLALGGNKTRKLEYLMGEAVRRSSQIVVTQGAVQSNHVVQTAAAAARCGMECTVLLERRVPDTDAEYEQTGNVLLNDIFKARYEFRPAGGDMNAEGMALRDELARDGGRVYFIPGGGSNDTGALGYAHCALELSAQARESGINIDWVVHATGSAGTQAGLLAGYASSDSPVKVLGVSVRADAEKQKRTVRVLAQKTLARLGGAKEINEDDVRVDDRFVGPGYGQMTEATAAAVRLLARTEGILLDPVYSGKGFAGLLARIREGAFGDDDSVVFLHTGGAAALFAYRSVFSIS
ncbi:MAG: D-cysteine desulfhydrase [Gammaproteobacteria bacterium]